MLQLLQLWMMVRTVALRERFAETAKYAANSANAAINF
jgi:hypothetical protein